MTSAMFTIGLAALLALVIFVPFAARIYRGAGLTGAVNIAEGTHINMDTRYAEEAIATRYLLVKKGAAELGVLINGAGDRPCGVCNDKPENGLECEVTFFGSRNETLLVIPAANIGADVRVFTAAGGKVQAEPAVAGVYYEVGTTRRAGTQDEPVEIDPCPPRKLVVAAAPADAAAIAAAMNGAHITKFLA